MQAPRRPFFKDSMRVLLALCLSWWVLTVSAATPDLDLSQYRGKVVYLDFWASWCKPCRQSFPWMNRMQDKYGDQGLVIIAVDEDEDRADADRFLKELPAKFQVLYDSQGKLAEEYKLIGMPSSFIIDRAGAVHSRHAGFHESSPAEYEAEIQSLLQ
ncbi:MAG TPA: TlpA disulfide reductase family protein [Gammaproteobacteria bacterium]|nr:TlpA disulfide reductase family protein [Gammaproteobacteria bacterium]